MIEISTEEYNALKEHSRMLGQIGCFVEEFAEDEEDTTLICVLRALTQLRSLQADELDRYIEINKLKNK